MVVLLGMCGGGATPLKAPDLCVKRGPPVGFRILETALPSPGFYPEISGFFEAVGIFWGFYF